MSSEEGEDEESSFSSLGRSSLVAQQFDCVCAVLQKFCLFSACVVYRVFNSIIGVVALGRGCFRLGPRPLWIAWISSNIVAKL